MMGLLQYHTSDFNYPIRSRKEATPTNRTPTATRATGTRKFNAGTFVVGIRDTSALIELKWALSSSQRRDGSRTAIIKVR